MATEPNQSRISLAKLNVILPTGITITVEANLSSSLAEFQVESSLEFQTNVYDIGINHAIVGQK